MVIYKVETILDSVFVATLERAYEYVKDYLKDNKATSFCDEQDRKISKKKVLDLCEWRSLLNGDLIVYASFETIVAHCDFISINEVKVLE